MWSAGSKGLSTLHCSPRWLPKQAGGMMVCTDFPTDQKRGVGKGQVASGATPHEDMNVSQSYRGKLKHKRLSLSDGQ